MKTVYFILNGENQVYFLDQKKAETHAEKNGGEIFQEDLSEKEYKECLKKKDFFQDLPQMEVKKNGKPEPETPEELKHQLELLKKENEQFKRYSSLSFEEAAKLYSRKAKLLQDIGKFEKVLLSLSDVELKRSDDSINTEGAELVLLTGTYSKVERFKINNIHVISDFIEFTALKVNNKIELLKAEVREI